MTLSREQADLVDLLVERQALRFGDFTLKSGRKSPYFCNFGQLCHGGDIDRLGAAYGAAIRQHFGDGVGVVFGPAYKGIPLALAAAHGYQRLIGRPVGWAFDRKEAKEHGEGGSFVGAPLTGGTPVVVVDDVITDGAAKRETMAKLGALGARVVGMLVGVDRQEPGPSGRPALQEFAADYGMRVAAIVTIREAVEHLAAGASPRLDAPTRARILAHVGG